MATAAPDPTDRPPLNCTLTDCPGNLMLVPQLHAIGDNECGYLRVTDAPPLPKNRNDRYHICRRPSCSRPHLSAERRNAHEADATKHTRPGQMTFICDWAGHADAIDEAGLCPVCQ